VIVQELLQIVQRITKEDAKLPEGIDPAEHPQAMDTAPNMDLLLRQRTFSIDETREVCVLGFKLGLRIGTPSITYRLASSFGQQLRQGRPVQRDAVIAGGVDYGALMYGEHYDSKPEEGAARQSSAPKGYAAALLSGAKATPDQPVPMKAAAAKPTATPQKQPVQQPQPASAPKPAPSKEAGEKEKGAKPAGKSNRRGKGNRGGNGEAAATGTAEAQPAKVWCERRKDG